MALTAEEKAKIFAPTPGGITFIDASDPAALAMHAERTAAKFPRGRINDLVDPKGERVNPTPDELVCDLLNIIRRLF